MIIKLNSYVIQGLKAEKIIVESSVSPGLAKFEIIGLADTAIKESKERIFKSLLENGYKIPPGNITINLAPAKIKKRGPLYDLPISLGLLLSSGQIQPAYSLENLLIAGELSLDGSLRAVEGVFITVLQNLEEKMQMTYLMPQANQKDFQCFQELKGRVFLANDLKNSIEKIVNSNPTPTQFHREEPNDLAISSRVEVKSSSQDQKNQTKIASCSTQLKQDFKEVMGHDIAKLAIQLSIISKLNLLLIGPPGGGKSMLMKKIPSILPNLSIKDSLMVTRIHHACLRLGHQEKPVGLIKKPPFREVHNSIHTVSLIGGGRFPEPGEISLAHQGYLFLDELSEYSKDSLQSLRIPMESKSVTINRAEGQATYPCNFTLLACTNPCACGYYGDAVKMCCCSKNMMQRFFTKLSGPILDRFDLVVFVNQFDRKNILGENLDSSQMKQKVISSLQRKKTIPNPFIDKTIAEIFSSYPVIGKILTASLEKKLISFRKIKSILRTCYALQLYSGSAMNKDILFQAIEFCRNKFAFNQTN